MTVLKYIQEVSKLPARQREVLVPLVAWQLSLENPGFDLGSELEAIVDKFLDSLGPDPAKARERLDERLQAAGVTKALLREIQAAAKLPPLAKVAFEPRRPPAEGQFGGALGAQMLRVKNK